jgi:HSP20 family protein
MLDCENEVIVRAEVPGVNKEHMDVSVSDHTVTIRGDIRPETEGKGEYLCHETTHGAFSPTIVPLFGLQKLSYHAPSIMHS